MVPGYGRDDADVDRGGGINLVPGKWEPPSNPSAEDLAAARLWMRVYDSETAVVSADALRKWLVTFLGNLAIGSGSGESDLDVRVRLLSVAIDDRAAKHFTRESLKLAWGQFKFTPAANELMAFFDDLESRERTEAQRLLAVLDAGAKPPPPKAAPVDVDESMRLNREQWDRERRELAAVVEAKHGKPPPTPARLQDETDKAYVARLRLHMDAELDRATKRMRGGMRMKPKGADKPVPPPTPEAMRAAYSATGIKPKDVRTDDESAEKTMSGGEG